jgi:BirA family biotin operon repressor/biotin-[acetyl-CoA-carboxylase] ligase
MFTTAIHAPHHVTTASLCAGVAVARALQVLCDLDAKVKWPNDVMINDRKAAGILCDLTREWLLLGVGVNLLQKSFPNEIADSATSVVLAGGKPAERDALLRMILQELRPMVRPLPGETEDKWLADLRARLFAIGRLVVVRLPPDSEWQGVLRDVDDDGRLVLEKGGRIHRVVAGEIVLKL